ncbi:MAG: sigma-54-dependent Fis family transcriptional regulator [Nitrospiraceae bacterium]|nr:MAG: sigma-54-dependent Fis family transcriptional regulator [Nitrospiraceae bacterium]
MLRVLVIDDEESIRNLLSDFLESKGMDVVSAPNGAEGLNLLKGEKFDLFLLDLMMPGMTGLDVLRQAAAEQLDIPSIMITAFATVQTAVEAMKLGAYDYITKPFNLEELYITVKKALDFSKLQEENLQLRKALRKKFSYNRIIGNSPPIQDVIKFIEKIADTDSTVLITGESGTGKELVAKTIHYNSQRAKKPFIPLNCAAIPKDILESELFGHEKGAFTGAISTRIGRFELANQGTLFLDEIGELAPALQVKLLRVLQEKEFERVGGIKTIKVDVRIIAATNRDLEKGVRDGVFREDLYYRLNVLPVHLPPLRRMKEDIPLLVDHFIKDISRRKKKEPPGLSGDVMNCLANYRWPGNVRELENLVERLIILKDGDMVSPDDLPERMREKLPAEAASGKERRLSSGGVDLNMMLDEIENNMIIQALELSKGVKSKAASLLGLNRTTLIEKMKKKSIDFGAPQK